jgi:ComF family protein
VNLALRHPRTWPLWDVFFPPLCAVCLRALTDDDWLYCARCWAEAPVADLHDLHKLHHVDMVRAGYRYAADDVVRAVVHALKYESRKRLAAVMARKLLSHLPPRFVEAEVVWTPVPLHWRRQMQRGFNQSELIARELAALTGHALPVRLLKRVRNTPTQTARGYRERTANVKGAFTVRQNISLPKHILLIDDVITTGATVDECARTLKNAGVEWVDALSFALAHQG